MKGQSFNRYELDEQLASDTGESEISNNVKELINNVSDLRENLKEKPVQYRGVEVFLKSGVSFTFSTCSIRISSNFVFFCEETKELAIPTASLDYYICQLSTEE